MRYAHGALSAVSSLLIDASERIRLSADLYVSFGPLAVRLYEHFEAGVKLTPRTGETMSVKLVFQDGDGHSLYNQDILYDGLAPLPGQNEGVRLPDGQQVTVVGRQIAYGAAKGGDTEVRVIFICEREKKSPRGGKRPLPGY